MPFSTQIQESGAAPSLCPIVQRVHGPALTQREFFQQYQKPGVPVIVTGLLEAEGEWDLDFLCQQLGDQPLPVRHYGQERYQQDKRNWTSSGSGVPAITLPFSRYAAMLRNGTVAQHDLYLARCSLQQTPLSDLPHLKQAEKHLGLRLPATHLNLWLGLGGHTSCLHYDPMDGTLVQLRGAKRILLFPPSQLYNLYPIPVIKHLVHGLQLRSMYSQVYPDRPDLVAFPRFERAMAHRQEIILQPKEILFLPAGWWHEVTALSDDVVCSINRFWNVVPLARALSSWSKWRAHLGGLLAAPHVVRAAVMALSSSDRRGELNKLIQRL
jgi:hypothetical protein